MKPLTLIDSPADWTSSGLQGREDEFTYVFSEDDKAELIKAVQKLKESGVASEDDVKQVGSLLCPLYNRLRFYASRRIMPLIEFYGRHSCKRAVE